MQLTAEQFNGIIASLRSDPLAGRRGAPRVGLRLRVTVIPCAETNVVEQTVWLRDLSVTGMGFVHSRPFPEGSHLVTRFHQADNESIAILVEVTRCKEVAPKTYEIGTRIDRLITREELGA
jgi:c-di-GMP-binding flagellar brake protein YcgR